MVKRVMMLMGPTHGHVLNVADADAAAGVTDGWARDVTTPSQPYDSSGQLPMAKWPASLRTFLTTAYGTPLPDSFRASISRISKANPTVITVGTSAITQFANGDPVKFANTGVPTLDNPASLVVAGKNAGAGTFTVAVDLSTLPADITNTGTVTRA